MISPNSGTSSLRCVAWAAALGVWALTTSAHAHKPSDSYLSLQIDAGGATGHWDIALRDLDRALTLDADGDGALTWGEVRARESELGSYAFEQLAFRRGGAACALELDVLGIVEHSDGGYARLPFAARCAGTSALALNYGFFFELDPQHRAVVRVRGGENEGERTSVIGAARRELTLGGAATAPVLSSLAIVREGVGHILSGLDHVLFLLALLLPAALGRRNADTPTGPQIQSVLRDVVKVVTAFTLAHSLTLALAALGLVSLSARVIEPAIAASVALAALDNLRPMFGSERWSIAFVLGLLHGFGFSSALADLGLAGASLVRALFAFNVGVELGQLALVALFVPAAFLIRKEWAQRFLLVRGGSLAIATVSLVWLFERIGKG